MSGLGNNDAGFAIKAEKTCFSNQPHTLSNLVQHEHMIFCHSSNHFSCFITKTAYLSSSRWFEVGRAGFNKVNDLHSVIIIWKHLNCVTVA